MSQALAKTTPNGMMAPVEWEALRSQASALIKSGFLPKSIRTPEQALAIAMTGRELGIPTMQALRSIHVIEGKPTMSADLMAGLVHSRIPGAKLRVTETTEDHCTVEAARPGDKPTVYTFSIADAKRAGLTNKDNWRKYPRAMLRARCLSEAARAHFPDALMGVYDPDELGAVTDEQGEIMAPPVEVVEQRDNGAGKLAEQLLDDYASCATLAEVAEVVEAVTAAKQDFTKAQIAKLRRAHKEAVQRVDQPAEREPGDDTDEPESEGSDYVSPPS